MIIYHRECDPIDHMIHLQVLREMEEMLPMTYYERKSLYKWVHEGNDPELNPWRYLAEDGCYMNYLEAYRYHYGYKLIYRYQAIEE